MAKNNIIGLLILLTIIWFILIAVNVNTTLGLIYLAFTFLTIIYIREDKIRTILLDRTGKWLMPFFQGILIYAGFVIVASVLLPIFQDIGVGKLLQLIATTSPALAESKILNSISFVFFIPIIETLAFIVMTDYTATKFNIDITKKGLFKLSTWVLILGFSFLFLLYHVTAKGITNNAALLLVFLMMVVTLGFAIYFGEAKQVIFFHCVANAMGLGLLGIFTGVVSLLIFIKILNKYKKIPKI